MKGEHHGVEMGHDNRGRGAGSGLEGSDPIAHGSLPAVPVAAAPLDDPWLALASGPLTADLCECDAMCVCGAGG